MVDIDRFVDDLPSGSDFKEIIERLRGGFLLKVVACLGDENGPLVQKLGGAILGIKWDTETDKSSVPLAVNVTQ